MKTPTPVGFATTRPRISFILRAFALVTILILSCSMAHGQLNYNHPADCWLLNRSNYGVPYTGSNPSLAQLKAQMQSLAATYNVPIEVIAAICYRESGGMYQYGGDSFLVHNITECIYAYNHNGVINGNGAPAPPGLGLMQLTSTTATQFNPGELITDWRYNLEAGVQILVQKYNSAINGDPSCLINLRNQTVAKTILENWYYAIRYYYGSTRPDSEYLDLIYGYISNPPARLVGFFPAVAITKPQEVIPGFATTQGFCAQSNGIWTNYQCNTYSGQVHVSSSFGGEAGADLALQSVTVTQVNPIPGGAITIGNIVQNIGGTTSSSYTITFYASTDSNITPNDYSIGSPPTRAGLAPGATDPNTSTTGNLPANLPNGTYYIGAIVTVSPDVDPSNNVKHDPIPITVSSTQTGSLQVTINPAGAVNAGAQWQVDGGSYRDSGTTIDNLSVGTHSVVFKPISGWITPSSQSVTINANETTQTLGTYVESSQTGSLQVTINPAGAVNAGAQWQVDGGPYQNSGAIVSNLAVGTRTVAFKPISGWGTPSNESVTINANQTTQTTGTYVANPQTVVLTLLPSPVRWVDTRTTGGAFVNGEARSYSFWGGQIPSGAKGIRGNIVAVSPQSNGNLQINTTNNFPAGSASVVNLIPNGDVANNFTSALDSNGTLWVRANVNGGVVDVIIDIYGYYQ